MRIKILFVSRYKRKLDDIKNVIVHLNYLKKSCTPQIRPNAKTYIPNNPPQIRPSEKINKPPKPGAK